MNLLIITLTLAAAFGQGQLNPCAAVDAANNSYGPGRTGLVGCMADAPAPNTYKIRGPEPVDVPAIQVTHAGEKECHSTANAMIMCGEPEPTWTCADKSRILLKDVGGTWHCIKFGNPPTEATDHGN